MFGNSWKSKAATLTTLCMLEAIILSLSSNVTVLAQTISKQSVLSECTDVEIQKNIKQLEKGEASAFDALVACNSKAVPALIIALHDQDVSVRRSVATALGQFGTEAKEAVPALINALHDRDVSVRRSVATALGQIGTTEMKSLSYTDMQAIFLGIKEKDERINSLEKLLENAIKQPKFYVETYQNQGEFSMSQSKGNINISGTQGNVSGVAAAGEDLSMTGVAIGAISGNVTNTINQLPDSTEPNEPGIKELLTELQVAIEADKNLNEEDKAEALEQVKAIAEAGQKPEDGAMQKMAKSAMKFLKGTIADLPSTVELVQTCGKVLPLITKFFGLP